MFILYGLMGFKALAFYTQTGVKSYFVGITLLTILGSWVLLRLCASIKHPTGRRVMVTLCYTVISFLWFADSMYYSYFWSLLPLDVVSAQAGQVGSIGDSIAMLLNVWRVLLIIDLPLVWFLFPKLDEWSDYVLAKLHLWILGYGRRAPSWLVTISMVLAFMVVFATVHNVGGENSVYTQEFYFFHVSDALQAGPVHAKKNAGLGDKFSAEDIEQLRDNARLHQGNYTGIAQGKNLIVIQWESLQNFVVNRKVEGEEITPVLNRLLNEEGVLYYDDYYHVTSRGSTSDAEFVTQNSLVPSTESPSFAQYDANAYYGLPWLMRDNGYTAWVMHGYDRTFWNRDVMYPQLGFERFIGDDDYDSSENIGFGINDRDFMTQSISYIKEMRDLGKPFYAYLVTLTSHTPYEMPEKYQVLPLPDYMEGTYVGNYLQAIHYTDEVLGEFLEALRAEGLYDDTVIAIYGDHYGVQILNDEIGDVMSEYLGHHYRVDEITNVPLILKVPGIEGSHTISDTGSMMDFYPTIQNLFGYDNTKGLIFGEDLNNITEPHVVMPQTILRRGSFITQDRIYSVSRDEIFEHGTYYDRKTYDRLTQLEDARPIYEQVNRTIGLGEMVLRQDMIRVLLEGGDPTELLQQGANVLLDEDLYTWDGTKRSLNQLYRDGVRQVIVNGHWVDDAQPVSALTGDETSAETVPDAEEPLVKPRVILGDDGMDFEDVLAYLDSHPDLHLVLETDEGDEGAFFEKLGRRYRGSGDQIIAGIRSYDAHFFVSAYGYHNMVLDLRYEANYTPETLKNFLNGRYLPGVILPNDHDGKLPKVNAQGEVRYFRAPKDKPFWERLDDKELLTLHPAP